jgi:small-conductance mechanosensitive channel
MLSIQEINSAIIAGNFTNDQMTSIGDAVRFARAQLGQQNKRNFQVGDNVSFNSTKLRQTVRGKVRKIAIKYVTVDTGQTLWKVPASMLLAA